MFVAPWHPRPLFWIALGAYCVLSVVLSLAVSQGEIEVGADTPGRARETHTAVWRIPASELATGVELEDD